jgi:hypothetical protein
MVVPTEADELSAGLVTLAAGGLLGVRAASPPLWGGPVQPAAASSRTAAAVTAGTGLLVIVLAGYLHAAISYLAADSRRPRTAGVTGIVESSGRAG